MNQLSSFGAATISVVPPRQLHIIWLCIFGIAAAIAGGIATGASAIIPGARLIVAACKSMLGISAELVWITFLLELCMRLALAAPFALRSLARRMTAQRMFTVFCLVVLACVLPTPSSAQQVPEFHVSTDNVLLNVLLVANGVRSSMIGKSDLKLMVDGHPQPIDSCITLPFSSTPHNIFLVIDRTSAIRSVMDALPDAFEKVLATLPPTDQVAIILGKDRFRDPAQLIQPLTSDHALLRSTIRKVVDDYKQSPGFFLGGMTMDSLYVSLPLIPSDNASGRNIVIVISDDSNGAPNITHGWGVPPQEVHTYKAVAREFEERNIAVNLLLSSGNVVSQAFRNDARLMAPLVPLVGGKVFPLESLVRVTGGLTIHVNKSNVADAIDDLLSRISGRYVVAFRPPEKDGKMHSIRLELTSSARKRLGKVKVVTRKDYRAPDSTHS